MSAETFEIALCAFAGAALVCWLLLGWMNKVGVGTDETPVAMATYFQASVMALGFAAIVEAIRG